MPTLARRNPSLVKAAAGDVQTFEDSLATIGRSYLTPKAPGLFKHEIGFQVLDQNEDNTRAVGVFGFRVGDRILYVPMFYRDGVVKGTEQLRDPKRKLAVPLSDNWINKFLSERGDEPPELRSRSQSKDTAQPAIWQLKYPPTKYAADETQAVKSDLGRAIGRRPQTGIDAPDLIKVATKHPELLAEIGKWAHAYPWFSDALERYHGKAKIAAALAEVQNLPLALFNRSAQSILPSARIKAAAVSALTVIRVTTARPHPVAPPGGKKVESFYDPEEWEELQAGRNAYKDNRGPDETSKITWLGGVRTNGEQLGNPANHGVYEVLVEGHEFEPCVVLRPLVGWGESRDRCLVIRLKDKKWAYAHPNSVWVRGEADQPTFANWVDELPKVKDKVEGVPTGTHAAVCRVTANSAIGGGGFEATVPFTKYEDGDVSCFPEPWYDVGRPFWAPTVPDQNAHYGLDGYQGHAGYRRDGSSKRVEVYTEASRPVVSGNHLYLPVKSGLVKLEGRASLQLGNGTDPERVLFRRHTAKGEKELAAQKTASGIVFHDPRTEKPAAFTEATDAEAYLVESHGFRVPDARRLVTEIVKSASVSVLVKYAGPYDSGLSTESPNAPAVPFDQVVAPASFADDVVPTETGTSVSVPITDMLMQPGAYDRFRPHPVGHGVKGDMPGIGNGAEPAPRGPDSNDLQSVATAAQSGRRELFDTAALAALVKHKQLQTLLNEVRGPLGRAVTHLGDLLAHCYWNTDEWAEQFGESEIGPIEDQLLSQFQELGDLVLTLQEKAVGDGPDAGILPGVAPADAGDSQG